MDSLPDRSLDLGKALLEWMFYYFQCFGHSRERDNKSMDVKKGYSIFKDVTWVHERFDMSFYFAIDQRLR